jgi:hypothetical protein
MWAAASEHADQVALLERQLSRMKSLAEAEPRYAAVLKKLAANPDIQQLTYAAPQPALAVAQLQTKLGEILRASSAISTSSQNVPEAKEGALTKIAVQSTIEADVKALTALLHEIDTARPLLHVERLVVRDPDGEWMGLPAATISNIPNKLQVELVVSAYMRAQ